MASYSAWPTVSTGDQWTASNHNVYGRDNNTYFKDEADDHHNRVRVASGSPVTISTGAITVLGSAGEGHYKVSGEGASADDLVTINGGSAGDVIVLEYDGEAITLKDGTGNILTGDYGDLTLDTAEQIAGLLYDGSNWKVLFCTVIQPTDWVNDTTPVAGGDVDFSDNDAHNFKQVDFEELHDNSTSGTSKTIDWNEGNRQLLQLTGDACDLSYTDPPGPCSLTLRCTGDGTIRTVPDADHDADAEWADSGEPSSIAGTSGEVVLILLYDFDPDSTPKYIVSGITLGA